MANANTRLNTNMSMHDMLVAMCEGNPGALTCMMQMIQDNPITGTMDILLFDSLGIYGSKIYTLWNACCGRDSVKFKKTLQAFREGKFSREQIHENLAFAKPFI